MSKNYRLERTCLGPQWDSIIDDSPDNTIFTTSAYLRCIGIRIGLFNCYNNNEVRAAITLAESADGSSAILHDYLIYSGICFARHTNNQNHAQRLSERFEISSFLASELAQKYEAIEFALGPSVSDIRPFLWYNYDNNGSRYSVDIRYTTSLPIADFLSTNKLEDISIYRNASSARRQQIRYSKRDGVFTEEINDVNLFVDFYRSTMSRQGININLSTYDKLAAFVDALIRNGVARIYLASTADKRPGSIAVFANSLKKAYYLFGANDPELRNSPTGTAVLWDSYRFLCSHNIEEVDLEGVNSPHRGWFKLSFGGKLIPYYQINKHN